MSFHIIQLYPSTNSRSILRFDVNKDSLPASMHAVIQSHETAFDCVSFVLLPVRASLATSLLLKIGQLAIEKKVEAQPLTIPFLKPSSRDEAVLQLTMLVLSKELPAEEIAESVLMRARVRKSNGFRGVLLRAVSAEAAESPVSSNGHGLWTHAWKSEFWQSVLEDMGVLPMAAGDTIQEVEASPTLFRFLLPRVFEEPDTVQWQGCHYNSSPAKRNPGRFQ